MAKAAEINPRESFSGMQAFFLLFLRVVVGWHFLYEGFVKIYSEGWTAAGYLHNVPGPFASLFDFLISSGSLVAFVNAAMKYGLAVIGLLLILGLFTRLAAVGAAIFLGLFYISNPPWIGVHFLAGEGSYLIVNKNLVEMAAALVLAAFPSGTILGFDLLFRKQ